MSKGLAPFSMSRAFLVKSDKGNSEVVSGLERLSAQLLGLDYVSKVDFHLLG